jgi:hypothetical protein
LLNEKLPLKFQDMVSFPHAYIIGSIPHLINGFKNYAENPKREVLVDLRAIPDYDAQK